MTVLLDGRSLRRKDVVRVARREEPVELDPAALIAMAEAHAIVLDAAATGRAVYAVSTAVGVLKREAVGEPDAAAYSRRYDSYTLEFLRVRKTHHGAVLEFEPFDPPAEVEAA